MSEKIKLNKLNKLGNEILEYKEELLNNNHSKIVEKALLSSVTDLLSGGIINVDIHDALGDSNSSLEDVRALVLNKPNLTKTTAELKAEYDEYREPFFNKLMESISLSDTEPTRITSESHVSVEEIQIILTFNMTKEFIGDYFEREGEQLNAMMKPEGFAEKFAILRYSALVSKYLKSHEIYSDDTKRAILKNDIEIGGTKVFVNKDEEVYGVELVYHVPVDNLLDDETSENTRELLSKELQEAIEFVNIRTIA